MANLMRKARGFTLLEILLVIVIMSTIIVIGLNYTTQKMDELRRDKTSLQYQQILNASLAYYLNTGGWPTATSNPTTLSSLMPNYLPNITINNPWGNAYKIYSSNNILYVYSKVPSGTALLLANASTIAGRLPLAFLTTKDPPDPANLCGASSSTCYLTAAVTIPGQNLNNARAINYGNIYHHGACVPAPKCPSGMTPQIFAVPTSVSGVNDTTPTGNPVYVYPISSFTAYAVGSITTAPSGWTPGVTSGAPGASATIGSCDTAGVAAACNAGGGPALDASTNYWRVCLRVVTMGGTVSAGNSAWGNSVSVLAVTRCAPTNEPVGSDFTVYTP